MKSGYLAPIVLMLAGTGMAMPAQAQDIGGPPTVDWSGFYAGVYAGYGLDNAAASSSSYSGSNGDYAITQQSELMRIETLLGGAKAGVDYQIKSLVMGVEAGLTIGDFGKSKTSSATVSYTDPVNPADDYSATYASSSDFAANAIATIEGRIGWSTGNWLLYGKAGLAAAQGRSTASEAPSRSGPSTASCTCPARPFP